MTTGTNARPHAAAEAASPMLRQVGPEAAPTPDGEVLRRERLSRALDEIRDHSSKGRGAADISNLMRMKVNYTDLIEIIVGQVGDKKSLPAAPQERVSAQPAAVRDFAEFRQKAVDDQFRGTDVGLKLSVQNAGAKQERSSAPEKIEREPEANAVPAHKGAQDSKGFRETPQHTAIFKSMSDCGPGAVIEAVAGSGKTTTLVEGTKRAIANGNKTGMSFLAFNRSIADSLGTKLPREVTASTIHGLCWKAIQRARGWTKSADSRIEHGRIGDAAFAIARNNVHPREAAQISKDMRQLWSLGTATLTPLNDTAALVDMAKNYGLPVEPGNAAYQLVPVLDKALISKPDKISFDEMIRDVVREGLPLERSPYVLVDEAQDLNRLQMAVIKQMKPGKVLAVGDRNQAIYAFRGADSRAMDVLAKEFGIQDNLPLSVSYRCPKSVVREAQRLVPGIEAAPSAPEGQVDHVSRQHLRRTILSTQPGDLVLCRTNAPLLSALFERRRDNNNGIPLRIVGGDGGKDLVAAMKRAATSGKSDSAELAAMLIANNAEERAQKLEERGMATAAEGIRDESGTLTSILGECNTVAEACGMVSGMFVAGPEKGAINFSSIHRSKGLEAERVVLLGSNLFPSKAAMASKSQALMEQEQNLLYVAITRARKELVMQEMKDGDLGGKGRR